MPTANELSITIGPYLLPQSSHSGFDSLTKKKAKKQKKKKRERVIGCIRIN